MAGAGRGYREALPHLTLAAVPSVSRPRSALHELLFAFRKLRPVDGQRQAVPLAGESERYLESLAGPP